MGSDREVVLFLDFPVLIHDTDGRVLGLVPRFDDDLVPVEGIFICHFLAECDTVYHAVETCLSGSLDDGDCVVCIPFADEVSFHHLVPILLVEYGTVWHIVLGEGYTGILVHYAHFGGTADNHIALAAVGIDPFDSPELLEFQFAVVFGADGTFGSRT